MNNEKSEYFLKQKPYGQIPYLFINKNLRKNLPLILKESDKRIACIFICNFQRKIVDYCIIKKIELEVN